MASFTLARPSFLTQTSLGMRTSHARSFCTSWTRFAAKPKVLLLDEIKLATSELRQLEQIAQVVPFSAKSRSEFVEKCSASGEYADIMGIYRHFGGARSVKVTDKFDPELVTKLPDSLKFIVHNGAGYDQLDVAALTKRSIQFPTFPRQ